MPDPTGTIGAKSINDMDLVLEGGPTFEERLHALEQHRSQSVRALNDLKLGQAAASAFREAKDKLAEASFLKEQAASELAKAQNEASRIVAGARTDAHNMAASAKAAYDNLVSKASKMLAAAEAEAIQRLGAVKESEITAKNKMSEADAALSRAKSEYDRQVVAVSETRKAKQDADTTAARYQSKIDRLTAVLRELT